jgi:hypothetical protein
MYIRGLTAPCCPQATVYSASSYLHAPALAIGYLQGSTAPLSAPRDRRLDLIDWEWVAKKVGRPTSRCRLKWWVSQSVTAGLSACDFGSHSRQLLCDLLATHVNLHRFCHGDKAGLPLCQWCSCWQSCSVIHEEEHHTSSCDNAESRAHQQLGAGKSADNTVTVRNIVFPLKPDARLACCVGAPVLLMLAYSVHATYASQPFPTFSDVEIYCAPPWPAGTALCPPPWSSAATGSGAMTGAC